MRGREGDTERERVGDRDTDNHQENHRLTHSAKAQHCRALALKQHMNKAVDSNVAYVG